MTTSSTSVYSGPYNGDGGNRVWTREFIVHAESDFQVVHILTTGEEVAYPFSSGFWSATGIGGEEGTVTFPLPAFASPVSATEKVRIERKFVETQDLDLATQGAYDPERVEVALDRRQFNELWLRDRAHRTMTAPIGYTGSYVLPAPTPLYALGWNVTGDALTNYALPSSVTAPVVRAVVDATDMAAVGITIPLDGVQDAAPALQEACDYLAAAGGALLTIRCPAGGGIRLNGRVRGATGVSISFVGCKVNVGANGGFALRGDPALVATAVTLASTLTAGSTACVVDVSALGGTALSTAIPVGSVVELTSEYDSAGTDKNRSRYTITAVNDGTNTLTLNRGADFEYGTATTVRPEVSSLLNFDVAEFDRYIGVANPSLFAVGDWVLVEDARDCPANGSTTIATPIRNEMARIIDISGSSITLSRKLEHDFTTANYARIVKINVITGCEVSGAAIVLVEGSDSYNHHIFDMRYAIDCRAVDSTIDHDTSYSRPSNNFRISVGTYNCEFRNCQVLRPKYYGAGEGYCFRAYGSTKARFVYCYAAGGRTGFICSNGATDTSFDFCWAHDQSNKGFDCHGQAEYTTKCQNCTVDGSNAVNDGTRYALAPGNPTYLAGAKRFSFQGGYIRYQDSGDIVLYACPPTVDVVVSGVRIDKPYRVISHFDVNGGANLVSERIFFQNCQIFEPQEWFLYAEGKYFGSTTSALSGLYIKNVTIEGGVPRLFRVYDVSNVWMDDVTLNPYVADGGYNYAMYAFRSSNIRVRRLDAYYCKSAMSFTDTTNFEVQARWADPVSGNTVFNDGGGNSGVIEWTGLGYTPNYGSPVDVDYIRSYP